MSFVFEPMSGCCMPQPYEENIAAKITFIDTEKTGGERVNIQSVRGDRFTTICIRLSIIVLN